MAAACWRRGASAPPPKPEVAAWGAASIDWWSRRDAGTEAARQLWSGRAAARRGELARFAQRTENAFEWIDADGLAGLGSLRWPGRFRRALFFPRRGASRSASGAGGAAELWPSWVGAIQFGVERLAQPPSATRSSSIAASCRARCPVRSPRRARRDGGRALARCGAVAAGAAAASAPAALCRAARERLFMIGATMIETSGAVRSAVRSAMELLSAALCAASGVRRSGNRRAGRRPVPGFSRQPAAVRRERPIVLRANGLFRHGFLCLAPTWRPRSPTPSARISIGGLTCGFSSTTTRMRSIRDAGRGAGALGFGGARSRRR